MLAAYRTWQLAAANTSADKTFLPAGIAGGFSADFGHDDILAGVASPAEVFPRIAGWLAERSGMT